MTQFELNIPSKLLFGAGRISETGRLARSLGSKCLLVTGLPSGGVPPKLAESLKKEGIEFEVFSKVVPNPTYESIDEAAAQAKVLGCEFVIGLGGGSAIDTAKGVAVAATHEGSIWPYAIGERPIEAKTLPILAIPTTSGTGSHCTQFSVISNKKTGQKPGMGSPYILPRAAVVDPELMLSLPPKATFFTGFDVFAHGVEAYTSKAASPMSDIFAERAISLACKHLPAVMANGADIEARAGMAMADTCAGIAISHAVVSLGHVMAHVLGGHFPELAHGDALFSIYREVLEFNSASKEMKGKHEFIARALSKNERDPVKGFDKFFSKFDVDGSLKGKAIAKEKLDALARDVFTYMKGVVDLNPVAADVPNVFGILEKSVSC